MRFEWDETKRAANLEKHGIDFADAHLVFQDPQHVTRPDLRRPYGEERFITYGRLRGRLVQVVHTPRGEECTRIVALRKANAREKARFED